MTSQSMTGPMLDRMHRFNLTIAKFAESINVSPRAVQRVLLGKSKDFQRDARDWAAKWLHLNRGDYLDLLAAQHAHAYAKLIVKPVHALHIQSIRQSDARLKAVIGAGLHPDALDDVILFLTYLKRQQAIDESDTPVTRCGGQKQIKKTLSRDLIAKLMELRSRPRKRAISSQDKRRNSLT